MLIIGYSRAPLAAAGAATIAALTAQSNAANTNPYLWTQDVSAVPNGARAVTKHVSKHRAVAQLG